jgi:hypothetical protein
LVQVDEADEGAKPPRFPPLEEFVLGRGRFVTFREVEAIDGAFRALRGFYTQDRHLALAGFFNRRRPAFRLNTGESSRT